LAVRLFSRSAAYPFLKSPEFSPEIGMPELLEFPAEFLVAAAGCFALLAVQALVGFRTARNTKCAKGFAPAGFRDML